MKSSVFMYVYCIRDVGGHSPENYWVENTKVNINKYKQNVTKF